MVFASFVPSTVRVYGRWSSGEEEETHGGGAMVGGRLTVMAGVGSTSFREEGRGAGTAGMD